MQVQVGQRISKRYTESPLSLYRALRSLNPSPYMYYYHLGDFHVVGASPEILVRQEHTGEGEQKITIRPLAGTRPRGASPSWTRRPRLELINDPKERAEHVMLIDLARNDIGRIAKTGTVKVTGGLRGRALQPRDAHREQCRRHAEGRHDRHRRAQGPPSRPAR
jgi:anthranilate synthase component 1